LRWSEYRNGPKKKHSWPADSTPMIVGDLILSEVQARDILTSSAKGGDAWIILAQKVIAAQLSILAHPTGADNPDFFDGYPGGMVGMIDDANDLLEGHGDPPHCFPGHPDRGDLLDLADTIDDWLNEYDVD